MRVAVVGYGRMGREVEAVLRERGHDVELVGRGDRFPDGCAVGVDFTRTESVVSNVEAALRAGARYVVGTTGWSDRLAEVQRLVEAAGGGLVHSANFSLGVNLFYRVVRDASALLSRFPEYDPWILERHHAAKKDAPSGTAKVLAGIVAATQGQGTPPAVASVRAGGIVGDHAVGFDSGGDEIVLEHRARSRRGFALGAVLAAEWIAPRTGFYSFDEVLAEKLRAGSRPGRRPARGRA
ncbi:MAG TPA: dihydrodipicolinate reductase C-terminal domain-containing protein [Vicinamibacteria bacterium]|nr:dihydrodipicolinate reductase C-terminal domain-containing protein [Vicinamibacteria bacterium]